MTLGHCCNAAGPHCSVRADRVSTQRKIRDAAHSVRCANHVVVLSMYELTVLLKQGLCAARSSAPRTSRATMSRR